MCMGITGVITAIVDDDGIPLASVADEDGRLRSACLLTCPDAIVGDTVAIHSGYVLRILPTVPVEQPEEAFR